MATSRSRKPRRAGSYVRISEDPSGQEKGVGRQKEDVEELAQRLGWQVGKVYEENDTSAYKRKRIRLADGRSVWRVERPEFRQMLRDYEDGAIDGIIVYDLDRLARQPRDLEDLIDLVDHFKRPVAGVTGSLDLMTENGKAMARVLVAMANKSSADTARRVARAKVQSAREGRALPTARAFGWQDDHVTLEPREAELLRKAVADFTAGETWTGITAAIIDSGMPTVKGGRWRLRSVKQMILSPRVAGIMPYRGKVSTMAAPDEPDVNGADGSGSDEENQTRSSRDLALRDAEGAYVRGPWEPIITVQQWEDLITEYERRQEGAEFTSQGTRSSYLLSGLLRCARPCEDGTPCNGKMVGVAEGSRSGRRVGGRKNPRMFYRCPGKVSGGCGNSQRGMKSMDQLIEDLLFLHLEENRPAEDDPQPEAEPEHPDAVRLADVSKRLSMMRNGMREGTVSPESFFAVVPGLEAQEKKLIAGLGKARRAQADRAARLRTPEEVRADWENATIPGRRELLGQYLQAVIVHPAQAKGRGVFDHTTIEPVWKPLPQ
ncbi:recombinase family protein [Streptomyces sp. ME19-01-6]|uniref:recombinase family protein n=1 Tax=Streptomyces sp. ME19-01-6 TaxID=3028686 RepID=UPI0029A15603|nr:recombinase family protein [Streptomyces sp. ME19-01-6]MDX3231260.1 recombinase family protein [Streptomyces sp. ME19-01-6]